MAENDIQTARRLINEFMKNPKQAEILREFQKVIEQMNNKSFETFKKLMPNDNKKQMVSDTADLIRNTHEDNKLIQNQDQKKTLEFNMSFRSSSKLEEALDAVRKDPDSKNTQALIEELPNQITQDPELREEFTQFQEHLQSQDKDMTQEMQLLNNLQQGNASESAKMINESRKNLGAAVDHIASTKYTYNTRVEMMVQIGDTAGELDVGLGEGKDQTGQSIGDKLMDAKSDMNENRFEQHLDQQLDATALDMKQEQNAFREELEEKQEFSSPFKPPKPAPPGTPDS